jgi:hypothetical protein
VLQDIIVVGGKNLHPQDLEARAGEVKGVVTGPTRKSLSQNSPGAEHGKQN